jgi:uncharacterized protein YjcR
LIWHTVDQAAERVGVQPRTIKAWIRSRDLPTITHPVVPGVLFVADDALLECYRSKRSRGGHPGPRP